MRIERRGPWKVRLALAVVVALVAPPVLAQRMVMPGMENTVGFLSSGTTIEPAVTSETTDMLHGYWRNWVVMFHADAEAVTIQQTGPRGHAKTFATNWIMPMLTRPFGRHSISLRTMLSAEPITVTLRRYPELFQSGETAYGLPIVDGQHPHNLIMEISGRYDMRIHDKTAMFLYGGPVADPALGPTAFAHRSSASENPLAPLGHHQQDSTHISDSVITAGLVQGPIQLEVSGFHGREPNENRWTIGSGAPDSFSSRVTIGPSRYLVGQFSIGRINSRESLDPDIDTIRTTASLQQDWSFASGHIASSLIWGRNKDVGPGVAWIFNSYALESTVLFSKTNWAWTRVENLDRDRTLLVGEVPAALNVEEDPAGRIQAYTFGYERDLPIHVPAIRLGLGAQITTYGMPPQFEAVYGSHPRSVAVFLRLRPAGNIADHMRMMHGH